MRYVAVFILFVFFPVSGFAKWYEASSDHFVIYANSSESNVHRFSQQLEKYHTAMVMLTGVNQPKPSPSNRVTVFVLKNRRQVQDLYGDGGNNIAGFYTPRAGGSVAFVSKIRTYSRETDFSMIILMHEYAHHFMYSNSEFFSPRWLSEGGAEFFASAKFNTRDGSLSIGRPAAHRMGELFYAKDVTVEELLDPKVYAEKKGGSRDSFYGKSWLLYHYLVFSEERRGQFDQYLKKIMSGEDSLDAGKEVFGSLLDLDDELDSYQRKRSMTAINFKEEALEIGTINVRQLRKGEAEIMDVRARSRRGVNSEQAQEVVIDARKVASKYPDDPVVMAALAEAEFDAGNDAAAIAAADVAIVSDSEQVRAYVQKGYALFRQVQDAKEADAAYQKTLAPFLWVNNIGNDDPLPSMYDFKSFAVQDDTNAAYQEALAPFLSLNNIENDHPLPLIYYFKSFTVQDKKPTELAIKGLERALELAPFDEDLRMSVVYQQIQDQRYDWVKRNLSPIAFDPHGNELSSAAQRVLERIDQGPVNDPSELMSILQR